MLDSFVGKLNYWIGHMYPDDLQAGYDLAQNLFDKSRKAGKYGSDGKIHVVGLSGSRDSTATIKRNQGLLKAAEETSDVILHQIFWTRWDENYAESIIKDIFYHYRDIINCCGRVK